MNVDDLVRLGFENRDGALRAPSGCSVSFVPLDARCYRVRIEMPSGGVLHFVVAAVAIRSEAARCRTSAPCGSIARRRAIKVPAGCGRGTRPCPGRGRASRRKVCEGGETMTKQHDDDPIRLFQDIQVAPPDPPPKSTSS